MAQVVEAVLKLDSKDAQKDIEKVNQGLQETNETLEDTGKTAEKSKKGLGTLSKGIKGIGTAFKAAGIGAVVALFGALAAALSKNQQVMDTVAIVTGTISQVFSEIGNVLVTVYNSVASSTENFDALGRVVSNVFKIAIAPFKLAIDGLALGFYNAQLAWEQSFLGSGDTEKIEALNSKIDETKQSLADTVVGIGEAGAAIATDFTEAVSEVTNIGSQVVEGLSEINVKAIAENVKANQQLKKSADEARIVNQGLIEQYDRQAEQQRQIRDNDLKSIDDRIAANDKLKETLEEQEKSMLANADLMIQQAELQFKLSGLEEDRLALLEARNEKAAIEAQIEGFMSEQESNRVALLKEKIELQQSEDEAMANRQNIERNFNAEMEQSEVRRIQMMIENLQTERAIEEERLTMKRNAYEEGTQAYIDANNELLDYQQDNANQQTKLERDLGKAKENQTRETLGNLATIVGQNSKFGKAIAVVQAIQDTFAGANKALSASPPPFNFVAAAAVVASGLANVKSIVATKTPSPTNDNVSVPATAPSPPAFNVVGASSTNQLADVIAEQAGQPTRAYVVSNDVSTAQELDRNIIQGASIG